MNRSGDVPTGRDADPYADADVVDEPDTRGGIDGHQVTDIDADVADASADSDDADAQFVDRLFVYGTLRRGDVRWGFLERFVADDGIDDAVAGALYDTGLDYPAAVFGPSGTIVGSTYRLRSDLLAEALDVLDEEEDTVLGLYRRVTVITDRGITAWAYAYGDGLELTPIPSGDWFSR